MSLERLLQLSFKNGLVDHYRLFPTHAEIYLSEGTELKCNPIEARFFVRGLLHGYWHRPGRMGNGSNILPESYPGHPIN